jgi:CPA1 family monovalent cation:H+ antiporter
METVMLAVAAVTVILAASALAKWVPIGSPLLLVVAGMGVSLLPFVPDIEVNPEWILAGILPPLLYSSAIRMPAVDLRRNFAAIGVFSVLLVVVTAIATGLAVHWVFPAVSLNVAIALGAVVSPTDAAAITIIQKAGAPARVVTVLSGESLLNDPTALVILRTALATAVSLPSLAWNFVWAIGAASMVGLMAGWAALRIGRRIQDPTSHTVFSFLVPFAAYLPVEKLGSSGLVAVVIAGLMVGQGAPRFISARNRLAQETNWLTVDMLAEGAVFLAMGLQLSALYQGFKHENDSATGALITAAVALATVLLVRAVFTIAMLAVLGHHEQRRPLRVTPELVDPGTARLGWPEGAVLQWAGLRGVVTLAAAQTLPLGTRERPALILIAFAVACTSLVLQGGTLPALLRGLHLAGHGNEAWVPWRIELRRRLSDSAQRFLDADGPGLRRPDGQPYSARAIELAHQTLRWVTVPNVDEPPSASTTPVPGDRQRREELREIRLATVRAMRADLLAARRDGAFPSAVLGEGFEELDREELAIELGPDQDRPPR